MLNAVFLFHGGNVMPVQDFLVVDSNHGPIILNRHDTYQIPVVMRTGNFHMEHELNVMLSVVDTLPKNCVFVDAGANLGMVTMPVAKHIAGRNGVVFSFEPQRTLYNALCGTLALNGLSNVSAICGGLGSQHGGLSFPVIDYSIEDNFGAYCLGTGGDWPVEVFTLDELALPRLDFLKMDVEGMELEVMRGAAGLITQHKPWCWVEYWKLGEATIIEEFKNLGLESEYTFLKVDTMNMLCLPESRWDKEKLQFGVKKYLVPDAPSVKVE
jgi:FkbM family methyltransferase